jgi:hypothetical protein
MYIDHNDIPIGNSLERKLLEGLQVDTIKAAGYGGRRRRRNCLLCGDPELYTLAYCRDCYTDFILTKKVKH